MVTQWTFAKLVTYAGNLRTMAMTLPRLRTIMWGAWGLAFVAIPATAQVKGLPRALPACSRVGQQVALALNTGTAGGFPPPGTADPIWTIVAPSPITPFTTAGYNAPTWWLPNSGSVNWIQPAPRGTPVNLPINTYVYSTSFATPVDPYLYTSITITGSFAADDIAVVKLNGIPIATSNSGGTIATAPFHLWTPIPAGIGWNTFIRSGSFLNTITVEVKNTVGGSPTGLMLAARVIAVCSKCTAPPPPPGPPTPPTPPTPPCVGVLC